MGSTTSAAMSGNGPQILGTVQIWQITKSLRAARSCVTTLTAIDIDFQHEPHIQKMDSLHISDSVV
jgi:hypothetical protein